MLAIHFTREDVAHTRIAAGPDPLWELVLAIHMLRGQRGDLLFGNWRRATTTALRGASRPHSLRLLSAVTPTFGYFPDFLTPVAAGRGHEHGLEHRLETVRATPVRTIAAELARLPSQRRSVARELATGDMGALTALTDGMREFYQLAVAPHERQVEAAVHRDRASRAAALADGGIDALLGGLHPRTEWSDGVLRVMQHADQRIDLGGRGLLLVPSYFGVNHPMTLFDASLPPVLVYPVQRNATTILCGRRGLPRLLGGTRAAILDVIGTGCGTADVARRAGVAMASASEHVGVLRDAGLVSSERDGNRVVHRLTGLGLALLRHEGDTDEAPPRHPG